MGAPIAAAIAMSLTLVLVPFTLVALDRSESAVHRSPAQEFPQVTKKEIVKTISEEIGLTQLKTKEIVQKTFDAIVQTLVEDGRIELRNFGVFEVKKRAARKARNPRTGDRVDVPEKYVVTFKPGKEMEERVRQLEEEKAARLAAAAAAENAGATTTSQRLDAPVGSNPESPERTY
jgi:nucleoid DNA-binding protein